MTALKLNLRQKPSVWITAVVLVFVSLLQLIGYYFPDFDLIEQQERITYDWRVRVAVKFPGTVADNLGLVDINDDSLRYINDNYGSIFPFFRPHYAQLIKELDAQGAKAVGFDIFFADSHSGVPVKTAKGEFLDPDEIFAFRLHQSTNAILSAGDGSIPREIFRTNAWTIGDISAGKDLDGILRRIRPFMVYTNWNPILVEATSGEATDLGRARVEPGHIAFFDSAGKRLLDKDNKPVELPLDENGKFKATDYLNVVPPGTPEKQDPYKVEKLWHLGIIMGARSLGLDLDRAEIKSDRIIIPGPNGISRTIPLAKDGSMYINWSIPVNDSRMLSQPLQKVLDSAKARASGDTNVGTQWKGRVVVVGSTGTGNNVSDVGPTPLTRHTHLVSKHWNVANSVITNMFITRSSNLTVILLVIVIGIGTAVLTWKLPAPTPTIWILVGALVYVVVAFVLFIQFRYWLPIVIPVVGGMFLNHGAQVSYQVIFEQKEKRRVRGVFSKVVSPNVVNELLKAEHLNLGGTRRNITVFFSDVRGFTQMTDAAQRRAEDYVMENKLTGDSAEQYRDEVARETLATVNVYLATIANQIEKHEGTLDKYIGDCVMAFWGAPLGNDKHAEACVLAAIDAQRAMFTLNQTRFIENKRREEENTLRQASGLTPLEMLPLLSLGTGINSGSATVGLMGSLDSIFNYTVFGGVVNLASRLEGLSGRGRIIIGEATYKELQRTSPELAATAVELSPAMLKGISVPVANWEVPWRLDKDKAAASNIQPISADSTSFVPKSKPAEADSTAFIPKDKEKKEGDGADSKEQPKH